MTTTNVQPSIQAALQRVSRIMDNDREHEVRCAFDEYEDTPCNCRVAEDDAAFATIRQACEQLQRHEAQVIEQANRIAALEAENQSLQKLTTPYMEKLRQERDTLKARLDALEGSIQNELINACAVARNTDVDERAGYAERCAARLKVALSRVSGEE